VLKLGSLFDGIGGWQIAAIRAGILPVWSSEVEKFPVAVTRERFPGTQQLGDINNIDGAKIPPVDIIAVGSPCQDLSIAGKRKGLNGERSGLFVRATNIIRQMHAATDGKYPVFVVWENVPGAFSSNKGLDFREVLQQFTETEIPIPGSGKWAASGMVRSGKCEVAWRTLDAQYWGVPQRRRRIFLVADYSGRRCAGKILFEPASVQGNIETCAEAGERVTAATATSVSNSGPLGFDSNASITNNAPVLNNKVPTIKTTTRLAIGYSCKSYYEIKEDRVGSALRETGGAYDGGSENYFIDCWRNKKREKSGTIQTNGNSLQSINPVKTGQYVRRLTPLECERLQGLPDTWTLINDKSCSDTARYKAIGNGMAQPCADFVMRQISKYGKE
jgi:DNA (cytosine-5)-methyltransferase 1